jgi:hypothetical protein
MAKFTSEEIRDRLKEKIEQDVLDAKQRAQHLTDLESKLQRLKDAQRIVLNAIAELTGEHYGE